MKKILIRNGIVITVDAADTVWQKGWILVADDRIEAMGEGEAPAAEEQRAVYVAKKPQEGTD